MAMFVASRGRGVVSTTTTGGGIRRGTRRWSSDSRRISEERDGSSSQQSRQTTPEHTRPHQTIRTGQVGWGRQDGQRVMGEGRNVRVPSPIHYEHCVCCRCRCRWRWGCARILVLRTPADPLARAPPACINLFCGRRSQGTPANRRRTRSIHYGTCHAGAALCAPLCTTSGNYYSS